MKFKVSSSSHPEIKVGDRISFSNNGPDEVCWTTWSTQSNTAGRNWSRIERRGTFLHATQEFHMSDDETSIELYGLYEIHDSAGKPLFRFRLLFE